MLSLVCSLESPCEMDTFSVPILQVTKLSRKESELTQVHTADQVQWNRSICQTLYTSCAGVRWGPDYAGTSVLSPHSCSASSALLK